MTCKTKHVLIFLVLVLITLNIAYAVEDFDAVSSYREIHICRGGSFQDVITVTNTGTSTIVLDMSADQDWAVANPERFILEPFDTQEVTSIIRPPSKTSSYGLDIMISTGTLTKVLRQEIIVEDCVNLQVDIEDEVLSNCPCTPTMFTFHLTNTGSYIETYDLSIDTDSSYYTLSSSQVMISPKQTEQVFAYMNLPCDEFGNRKFKFIASARSSSITDETQFYLDIMQSCYDYDIMFGKEIVIEENMTQPLLFVPNAAGSYELCSGTDYIIPLEIKNNAGFWNTFSLSSDIKLSSNSVELGGNRRANLVLMIEDLQPGRYSEKVEVISERGMLEKSRSLDLKVLECGGNISRSSKIDYNDVKNGLYILLLPTIILILVLLLYLSLRKRSKKEKQKTLIEEEPVIAEKNPLRYRRIPYLIGIIIILVILLLIYLLLRYLEIDVLGFFSQAAGSIWGFIIFYKLFFIIGIILAILIILLYILIPIFSRFLKRRKEMKVEEERILKEYLDEIKEKPDKKKKKLKRGIWVFLLVILLVILFLLSSLCFFTTVCENIGLEIVPLNQTNASEEAYANESTEIITENSTVYIWNKNKEKKIDLSDYIVNEEGDILEYISTPVENITVEVDSEGVVTLTPDYNWSGERVINFIIDDNKGGRDISPDIFLYVLDKEESFMDGLEIFLRRYIIYFFIGLMLSVLIVIILVMRVNLPKKKKILVRKKKKR